MNASSGFPARADDDLPEAAIEIRGLTFRYPGSGRDDHLLEAPVLRDVRLRIPTGVRCLLVGANGAGKTTLLNLLAGRHMVADETVRILGRAAFSDTSLVERLSYLGGAFPLDVDLRVDELLASRSHAEPERREHLMQLLGVERRWRMNRVSDGQRRRVQILLSLLDPTEVLLLDEVTTDLDVIARADLLAFLRRESEQRRTTILYATHIFDGLDAWATHLAYLEGGTIRLMSPLADIPELARLRAAGVSSPLLRLVERWLREGYTPVAAAPR